MSNLDKARECANEVSAQSHEHQATIEVTKPLTNQWVGTEKIQKWYDQVEGLLPYWAREDFESLLTS